MLYTTGIAITSVQPSIGSGGYWVRCFALLVCMVWTLGFVVMFLTVDT